MNGPSPSRGLTNAHILLHSETAGLFQELLISLPVRFNTGELPRSAPPCVLFSHALLPPPPLPFPSYQNTTALTAFLLSFLNFSTASAILLPPMHALWLLAFVPFKVSLFLITLPGRT